MLWLFTKGDGCDAARSTCGLVYARGRMQKGMQKGVTCRKGTCRKGSGAVLMMHNGVRYYARGQYSDVSR